MKLYFGPARSNQELGQAINLAQRVFGATSEEKSLLCLQVPGFATESAVVGVAESQVFGFIAVFDRTIEIHSQRFKLAYLSSICIDEQFRGEGHSRALMDASFDLLRQRDIDLAALIARKAVDGYYPKFGFWGLSNHNMAVVECKNPKTKLSIRSISGKDINRLNDLFSASYSNCSGVVVRSKDSWRYLLEKAKYFGNTVSVILAQEQIVGYVLASGNEIFELSVLEDVNLQDACDTFGASIGASCLSVKIPPEHASFSDLMPRAELQARLCLQGGHMIKAISPTRLVKAAEERLATAASLIELPPQTFEMGDMQFNWDGRAGHFSGDLDTQQPEVLSTILGLENAINQAPSWAPRSSFNLFQADHV